MRKNRNEMQVMFEFLSCLNNGETQTSSIMRKVNITYGKITELSKYLEERGMIKVTQAEDKVSLEISQKGRDFIDQYISFKKMMEKVYGLKI
jgi:predicted transcriptional regulator